MQIIIAYLAFKKKVNMHRDVQKVFGYIGVVFILLQVTDFYMALPHVNHGHWVLLY